MKTFKNWLTEMMSIGPDIRGMGQVSGYADGQSPNYVTNNMNAAQDQVDNVLQQNKTSLELHGIATADTKNDIMNSKSNKNKK